MIYAQIIFHLKDERFNVTFPVEELDNIIDAIETLEYGQPQFSEDDKRFNQPKLIKCDVCGEIATNNAERGVFTRCDDCVENSMED